MKILRFKGGKYFTQSDDCAVDAVEINSIEQESRKEGEYPNYYYTYYSVVTLKSEASFCSSEESGVLIDRLIDLLKEDK